MVIIISGLFNCRHKSNDNPWCQSRKSIAQSEYCQHSNKVISIYKESNVHIAINLRIPAHDDFIAGKRESVLRSSNGMQLLLISKQRNDTTEVVLW